ncbi:hypothetical protein GCM10022419_086150 [Nonomuraea rosea]|uniref:Uncharacterized protein n=1 Tax=Nonomuraea rosea TaxID=638574 RepID=A0ABP6YSS6_9ACTN
MITGHEQSSRPGSTQHLPPLVIAQAPARWKPPNHDEGTRGHGMHALRHDYASVLRDAAESVMVPAEYLGQHSRWSDGST